MFLIQNFPPPPGEEGPEGGQVPAPAPADDTTLPPPSSTPPITPPPLESTKDDKEVLNEEIFKFKSDGNVIVPEKKIERIQTLLDLLDYLKDQRRKGKPVISSMVIQIVSTLAGIGSKVIDDLINKGDRLLVSVDYGFSKQNSVGLRVNKVAGSDAISLSLKMDNKILASPFNVNEFNRQLIYYRNAMLNK